MVGALSAIGGSVGLSWFGGKSEDVRWGAAGLFFYGVSLGALAGTAAGAVVGSPQVLLFRDRQGQRGEGVASAVAALPKKDSKMDSTDEGRGAHSR